MDKILKRDKTPALQFWLLAAAVTAFLAACLLFEVRACEPYIYKGDVFSPAASEQTAAQAQQTFVSGTDTLMGVQLRLNAQSGAGGDVTVRLTDEAGTLLAELKTDADDLPESGYVNLLMDAPVQAKERAFTLTFSAENYALPVTETGEGAVSMRTVVQVASLAKVTVFVLGVFFAAAAAALWAVWRYNEGKMELHHLFAALFLLGGGLLLLFMPAYKGPDEIAHFSRVIEISCGRLVTPELSAVPAGLVFDHPDIANVQLRWYMDNSPALDFSHWVGSTFQNTSVYAPLVYLPQAAGALVMRLFTQNLVPIALAARACNLLSAGVILCLCIKHIPAGKFVLFVTALLPSSIQAVSAVSADGMTFALSALLLALVLRWRQENRAMDKKDMALLYGTALALSLCKIVYLPLCLLLFLIPADRFGGKKQKLIHAAVLGTVLVAVNLAWLAYSGRYLATPMNEGVDTAAQIAAALANPFGFIWTVVKTVFVYGAHYWRGMFGEYLGWMSIGLPWAVLYTLMAVLLYVSVKDNGIRKPTWGERILPLLCAVAVAGLTFASVYAQFTPFGGELVIGIQGRYFLPLVTAAVLGLKAWAPDSKERPRLACPLAALAAASLAGVLCVFIQSY